MMTVAPFAYSAAAVFLPMPVLEPVTMTTCPVMSTLGTSGWRMGGARFIRPNMKTSGMDTIPHRIARGTHVVKPKLANGVATVGMLRGLSGAGPVAAQSVLTPLRRSRGKWCTPPTSERDAGRCNTKVWTREGAGAKAFDPGAESTTAEALGMFSVRARI